MSWHRNHAFTLIELLISLSLLSMVMVIVTMSLDTGTRFNDRFSRQTDINNRANDVLNKLALKLRLAAADDTTSGADTSLELPGAHPSWFKAKDPTKSLNVKAYYFALSTGLGSAPTWADQFAPFKSMIIHDYSVTPGRLVLQERDTLGAFLPEQILTEDVADNGFNLTRIGNTLQMSLTLRSQTRVEEEIIYTATAQTLFLRSTLNSSSGTSAMTFFEPLVDASDNPVGNTTGAPTVMFGSKITVVSSGQKQMTLFITAPIGKKVDHKSIVITFGNNDNSVSAVVDDGVTVDVAGVTVTRATYPPPDQGPSRNGTYSVTLTGNIDQPVTVTATVTNTDGEKCEAYKQY